MKYLLVILFFLYALGGRAENRASFPGDKVVTIDTSQILDVNLFSDIF